MSGRPSVSGLRSGERPSWLMICPRADKEPMVETPDDVLHDMVDHFDHHAPEFA